jgi:hypothetical protein
MDSSGNLRMVTEEEAQHMENLAHPVECTADLPPEKLKVFRAVDGAGNRSARKRMAKKLKADWHEYQIYRTIPK